jgi:hypothetical protein
LPPDPRIAAGGEVTLTARRVHDFAIEPSPFSDFTGKSLA